jgi:hypothetical protein
MIFVWVHCTRANTKLIETFLYVHDDNELEVIRNDQEK